MIDKQQIVDFLIDSDYQYWNNVGLTVSKRDLKVSIAKYNFVAEKLHQLIQAEIDAAWQKGYDSAFVTWSKNSAEFYK